MSAAEQVLRSDLTAGSGPRGSPRKYAQMRIMRMAISDFLQRAFGSTLKLLGKSERH